MATDDKVMSQAEIDALLSKNAPKPKPRLPVSAPAPVKPPEPPPVAAAPPPPPVAAPVPAAPVATAPQVAQSPKLVVPVMPSAGHAKANIQKYSSGEVGALQSVVADLARQVAKISSALQRIDQMEEQVKKIADMIRLTPEASKDFEGRIANMQAVVEVLLARSDNFRDDFQCGSCSAKNSIAVHVKCTSCGTENWMGWWPDSEKR